MRNVEYDAFGPWIYEVGREHIMPPLFASHFDQKDDHALLIKIPVNRERRELSPDMHLYDYVIGVYDEYLYIMKRVENEIEVTHVAYGDIAAIDHSVRLLNGRLRIYTDSEVFIITYNTSSQEIIERLINIIRKRSVKDMTFDTGIKGCNLENCSYGFTNLYKRLREQNPGISLVDYQQEHSVSYTSAYPLHRIFQWILCPRFLESFVFTNQKELIFVIREDGFSYRKAKSYELSFFYLPLAAIDETRAVPCKKFNNIIEVTVTIGSHNIVFYVAPESRIVSFVQSHSGVICS